MLYAVIITTRSSVIISDPAPAKALHKSVEMIKKWQQEGAVKFVGLTGPFTPMKTLVIMEATSHEEVFSRLASLPGTPYTDNAIYPLISLDSVAEYLGKLAQSA